MNRVKFYSEIVFFFLFLKKHFSTSQDVKKFFLLLPIENIDNSNTTFCWISTGTGANNFVSK